MPGERSPQTEPRGAGLRLLSRGLDRRGCLPVWGSIGRADAWLMNSPARSFFSNFGDGLLLHIANSALPICSISPPQLGSGAEAADPGQGRFWPGEGGPGISEATVSRRWS